MVNKLKLDGQLNENEVKNESGSQTGNQMKKLNASSFEPPNASISGNCSKMNEDHQTVRLIEAGRYFTTRSAYQSLL